MSAGNTIRRRDFMRAAAALGVGGALWKAAAPAAGAAWAPRLTSAITCATTLRMMSSLICIFS